MGDRGFGSRQRLYTATALGAVSALVAVGCFSRRRGGSHRTGQPDSCQHPVVDDSDGPAVEPEFGREAAARWHHHLPLRELEVRRRHRRSGHKKPLIDTEMGRLPRWCGVRRASRVRRRVYVATENDTIYVLYAAKKGNVIWHVHVGTAVETSVIDSAPTLSNGAVTSARSASPGHL